MDQLRAIAPHVTRWEVERDVARMVDVLRGVAIGFPEVREAFEWLVEHQFAKIEVRHDNQVVVDMFGNQTVVEKGPPQIYFTLEAAVAIAMHKLLIDRAAERGSPIVNEPAQFSTPEALERQASYARKLEYERDALF